MVEGAAYGAQNCIQTRHRNRYLQWAGLEPGRRPLGYTRRGNALFGFRHRKSDGREKGRTRTAETGGQFP